MAKAEQETIRMVNLMGDEYETEVARRKAEGWRVVTSFVKAYRNTYAGPTHTGFRAEQVVVTFERDIAPQERSFSESDFRLS